MIASLASYLDFAIETAYLAGRLTLGYFQSGVQPDFKSDDSPVTVADRGAEELIRRRIEERYPQHAIVGEEFGAKESAGTDCRWFIDPIDGTKAFIRGLPIYSVLLGLEIDGKVEVGAAYFPALDEMVAAATGMGCWWNGRRAFVSPVATLKQAFLAHADASSYEALGRGGAWARLQQATYHRSGMSDAYGHALVATGRAEIMLDPVLNAWDCGPFPVILAEAGGYFGDWSGNVTIYGREAISTNGALLDAVLRMIAG